jgi:hypothetical protein
LDYPVQQREHPPQVQERQVQQQGHPVLHREPQVRGRQALVLALLVLPLLVLTQSVLAQLLMALLVVLLALPGSRLLSWLLRSPLIPQLFAGRVRVVAQETCSHRHALSRARND